MIKNPGGDLDETLARRDLPLAQRIVSQVLDQIHAFNTLVQDPSIEFPKSFVEVLTKGLDALKTGDLERAKTILNTHTNEEPLNDQMFARLLALVRQQRLARATNPAALAAYAASGLSFGPVIERIVNDLDKNMTNYFIDLDSGDLCDELVFPIGVKSASAGRRAVPYVKSIISAYGVDAMGGAGERGLKVFEMLTVAADNWLFDALTPAALVTNAQLNLERDRLDGMLTAKKLPATWLFNTREGGVGILQITGFTDKPRGVKIRYKLVQKLDSNSQLERTRPAEPK